MTKEIGINKRFAEYTELSTPFCTVNGYHNFAKIALEALGIGVWGRSLFVSGLNLQPQRQR